MQGPSVRGHPDQLEEMPQGEQEGEAHAAEGEEVHHHGVPQPAAAETVDEEPEEGQEGDQPEQAARLGGGGRRGVRQGHVGTHDRRHPFSRLMSSTWTVSRLR